MSIKRAKPKLFDNVHKHLQRSAFLITILVTAIIIWLSSTSFSLPWQDQPMRLWMFDVGQGDALLLEAPTGERLLIDGGRDQTLLSKLGSVLPPWDRRIDAILLTHPDADHSTGLLSVIDFYDVETVYESGARAYTPQSQAYDERVDNPTLVAVGDIIEFGAIEIEVMWPEETLEGTYPDNRNDQSVVLLVTYGETSILLTGDAELKPEKQFASSVGDIDVLKVSHHGSKSSTSWELLSMTKPEVALIGVGENNSYGHPHPAIIERLIDKEVTIYRTDRDGDVLLTSYGGEPDIQPHPLLF